MQIRGYSERDRDKVIDIYNEVKIEEYSAYPKINHIRDFSHDKWEMLKFEKSKVYVLEDMGEIVAFGAYKNSYISFLYVRHNKQHMGYGEYLLEFLLKKTKHLTTLHTLRGNKKAINFYIKHGFEVVGYIDHEVCDFKVEVVELCKK